MKIKGFFWIIRYIFGHLNIWIIKYLFYYGQQEWSRFVILYI